MKLTCICALLIAFSLTGAAQTTERYCMAEARFKGFSSVNATFILRPWTLDSLLTFQDSTILPRLSQVTRCTTIPDVLNYMASLGWTLAGVSGNTFFYFKRQFKPSELRYPQPAN
ncbi:MAG TPA: hypothetical protein VKQ52_13665 [Puia sp.]|nr:hypothetical protein [Puia sp.]